MPDYRSYNRDPRRDYDGRTVRRNPNVSGPQPGIHRAESASRGGARSAGYRPAGNRPTGNRPTGGRPVNRQPQGRRPQQRRRRRGPQPAFFILLAVIIVVIIALIFIFSGGKKEKTDGPLPTPTVQPEGGMTNVTFSTTDEAEAQVEPDGAQGDADVPADVAAMMEEEAEQDNAPKISSSEQVQVSPEQLSVNTSLPSEWMNVLLLGTDERYLNEPARTDTMIIASINTSTGEVKLTSLMRDIAVEFKDVGKYNGTYRLNAANYFGGPLYAIKIINECFDMNIQYYVSVNFYGFTKIAQALGGIEVDITEAEMEEINKKQRFQAWMAYQQGIDESDQENVDLTTYGPNTHLNGRQTLAYARVRYVDNDFARTERQRTVISKLTQKLRGKSAAEILALLASLSNNVTTNLDLETVSKIAITVLSSDISNIETMHLPKNGTYTLDRRNNQEMFYDTDWKQNSTLLYNFIYE